MSYAEMVADALRKNKPRTANDIAQKAILEVSSAIRDAVTSFEAADLPFVVAALRLNANGLDTVLNDSGRAIADAIVRGTQTTVIDVRELKKQMGEIDNDKL